MNKRGGHGYGTMAERIAATKAAAATPAPTSTAAQPSQRGPESLRHCWVDHEHGRVPGLLLEWRRTAAGWQGRVVHPVRDPGGPGWVLVEEWLPAGALVSA
jgi:hypothetical protein